MDRGTPTRHEGRTQERPWSARPQESLLQLIGTLSAYVLLTGASYASMGVSLPLGLLLAALAGITLVRVFILQHDCAHRAYFLHPKVNDWVGAALGILTLAPHAYWRKMHLIHHATSGDLDRRGYGDIVTLTVDEYRGLKPSARLLYRLYRHPVTLVLLSPCLQFLVRFRLPGIIEPEHRKERWSIAVTNLGLLLIYGSFASFGDVNRWLGVHLIIIQVAAGIGIWLFFVQHQVEHPYWVRHERWSARSSALEGSSYLVLPRVLEWTVGWINLHHVHHLRPVIPNYLLRRYMQEHGLGEAGVLLPLAEALHAFRFKVFDEASGKMTGLPEPEDPRAASQEAPLIKPPAGLLRLFSFNVG
jgi:omega-6 fatty acid desaturase (delta-12 desaturase)